MSASDEPRAASSSRPTPAPARHRLVHALWRRRGHRATHTLDLSAAARAASPGRPQGAVCGETGRAPVTIARLWAALLAAHVALLAVLAVLAVATAARG